MQQAISSRPTLRLSALLGRVSPSPFPLHRSTLLQTVHRCALLPLALLPTAARSTDLPTDRREMQFREPGRRVLARGLPPFRWKFASERPLDRMYVGRRHLPLATSPKGGEGRSNERTNIDLASRRLLLAPPLRETFHRRLFGFVGLVNHEGNRAASPRQLRIKFRDIRRKLDTLSTITIGKSIRVHPYYSRPAGIYASNDVTGCISLTRSTGWQIHASTIKTRCFFFSFPLSTF